MMMKSRLLVRWGAGAIGAMAAASNAAAFAGSAVVTTFDTGRFLATTGEVYAGVFRSSVTIESLTVGEATFRAGLDELIEVSSVRVYVAPAMDASGRFELLSDEQIASGNHGVKFGIGRDVDRSRFSTALDVMQGLDLSHMLYTDGTMRVRVDVLLAAPLRDSTPGEHDGNPEVLLIGSFDQHSVRIGAVVGGNIDRPILADETVRIDPDGFDGGSTGISILIDAAPEPQPISIVGLDLFALGVIDDTPAIGYRVEIEPGDPASFNVVGVGRDWQRDLATPIAMLEEPEEFMDFDMGDAGGWEPLGGPGGMGLAMGQPFVNAGMPRAGGFSGGGGGGGGTPGRPFPTLPPDGGNGNGNGDNGGNGNGNGDNGGNGNGGNGNGPDDPVVPAPGTLLIILASALGCRRGRRRSE